MIGWMRRAGGLGAALALGGCVLPLTIDLDTGWEIRGSGHVVTDSWAVPAFDAVLASGAVRVVVERTGRERVTITAEDNLLPYLVAEVRGGALELGVEPGVRLSPRHEILVHVESYEVVELSASGAVAMEADLGWVDELWVSASGASSMTLWGGTDRLNATVSGASHLDALDLEARLARATASGASVALVWVRDRLDADASGASFVRFRGNPLVVAHVSGASAVTKW